MLKRLYVDNFRSLVKFAFEPGQLCLLVGDNGSGKTTVFEVLELVRRFLLEGATVDELFESRTLTRWREDRAQCVQLTIEDGNDVFDYRLEIVHPDEVGQLHVVRETLHHGGNPLFLSDSGTGKVKLCRDSGEESLPVSLLGWYPSRSMVGSIDPRPEEPRLKQFRRLIGRLVLARIAPSQMKGRTDGEALHPSPDFSNFADWYRHVSQDPADWQGDLFRDLGQVIQGFAQLRLVEFPENVRDLRVELTTQGKEKDYTFAELSDGQRALIALYALLHCSVSQGALLLLDEPDNFVALSEIQPWLVALADKVRDEGGQALVVSHHPEIIDYLASADALVFARDDGGSTTVRPLRFDASSGVKASVALARGWIDA